MPNAGWFLICLGVLFGYWGRAVFHKQYLPIKEFWWISLPILAFCLMFLVLQTGSKKNRDKAGKLDPKRRRGIENKTEYWPSPETGDFVSHTTFSQELRTESVATISTPRTPDDPYSTSISPDLEEEVGFEREGAEQRTHRPLAEPEWNGEDRTLANQRNVDPECDPDMAPEVREAENTLFSMEIMDFLRRLRMPRKSLTSLWFAFVLHEIWTISKILPLLI